MTAVRPSLCVLSLGARVTAAATCLAISGRLIRMYRHTIVVLAVSSRSVKALLGSTVRNISTMETGTGARNTAATRCSKVLPLRDFIQPLPTPRAADSGRNTITASTARGEMTHSSHSGPTASSTTSACARRP